ncbi:unnamed protein product, partial [Ectocarpus sp. 12 AP-2014]
CPFVAIATAFLREKSCRCWRAGEWEDCPSSVGCTTTCVCEYHPRQSAEQLPDSPLERTEKRNLQRLNTRVSLHSSCSWASSIHRRGYNGRVCVQTFVQGSWRAESSILHR